MFGGGQCYGHLGQNCENSGEGDESKAQECKPDLYDEEHTLTS